jgi:hypothetical protein
VTMRLLPGVLGVLLVPVRSTKDHLHTSLHLLNCFRSLQVSFITMRNFGFSNPAAVLTAFMVIFGKLYKARVSFRIYLFVTKLPPFIENGLAT